MTTLHATLRRCLPLFLLAAAVTSADRAAAQTRQPPVRYEQLRSIARPRAGFVVTSTDLSSSGTFTRRQEANGSGCTGQNLSPALSWSGAPAGTRSFAITMFDPDAPTGSGFWHWIVYDIPATVTSLPAGAATTGRGASALPRGSVQGTTDAGTAGYGGPCPPVGDGPHRYLVTVHALRTDRLEVPAGATAAVTGFILNSQTLATARLTARYGRSTPAAPSSTRR